MCGICGELNYRDGAPADGARVERMTRALAHRGPDDEGLVVSGAAALGFRRLSIIDLEGGHQPMANSSGTVWVAFNGEIYNFVALRDELRRHGHSFRTRSDTEVVVHAYEQWGLDALEHLNGMFGLAIWDAEHQRLLLARDRAGVKPLYYHVGANRVLFGSEIRAVVAGLGARPSVDPVAANLFLRYRYTPSPLTLYGGIRKLAPGTRVVVEAGAVREERWWSYDTSARHPAPLAAVAEQELFEIYDRAIERQLVSDVPLGLLLSGGVDSGLLLALMNRHGSGWPTFTVGFGSEFADDELVSAAATARLLGSAHTDVQIDRSLFETSLAGIVGILEEPVASPSIVPMYFVCQLARQHVKTAFVGQGPDELFGGYRRHLGVRYGDQWRRVPGFLRGPLAGALARVPRNEWLQRARGSLGEHDRLRRYQEVFSLLPGSDTDELFKHELLGDGSSDLVFECWRDLVPSLDEADELGGLQYLEVNSSLPDELLLYADKLSMHHGLELRVPFLDHEIIEYAARLPAGLKIRHGRRKWLHKRVCGRFLPSEVIRRRKRGFAVNVVDEWFRSSLSGQIDDTLMSDSSLIYEMLRTDPVRRLVRQHREGHRDNHKILFSLVVLETWLRQSQDVVVG